MAITGYTRPTEEKESDQDKLVKGINTAGALASTYQSAKSAFTKPETSWQQDLKSASDKNSLKLELDQGHQDAKKVDVLQQTAMGRRLSKYDLGVA